jgi:hypothetical protein
MPFDIAAINKYLPLIQTGLSVAGNYLGGRAQTNALTNAGQINQQATNDAMRMILGLYDEGQASLAPYRSVGPNALNNLQAMANPGRTMAPIAAPTPPAGNAMARFSSPNPAFPGSGGISNAMAAGGNPQALAAGGAAKRGLIGTGVGMGAAAGIGAGLGSMTALGALGGPIGMGLGAAGGLIASQFGKNNPYKAAASKGIDEVSRNIWGTNTPGIPPEQLTQGYVADAIHRRIPVAEAKAKINADLNEWVAGMRANGTPDSVLQSSIATQKQYLAPLKDIFARLEMQPA